MEAMTPLASMSRTRAWMSKQPGRISAKEVGSIPYSSTGRPATALSPMLVASLPSKRQISVPSSRRSTTGTWSAKRAGMRSANMSGGSTTWSSTLTRIRSSSSIGSSDLGSGLVGPSIPTRRRSLTRVSPITLSFGPVTTEGTTATCRPRWPSRAVPDPRLHPARLRGPGHPDRRVPGGRGHPGRVDPCIRTPSGSCPPTSPNRASRGEGFGAATLANATERPLGQPGRDLLQVQHRGQALHHRRRPPPEGPGAPEGPGGRVRRGDRELRRRDLRALGARLRGPAGDQARRSSTCPCAASATAGPTSPT